MTKLQRCVLGISPDTPDKRRFCYIPNNGCKVIKINNFFEKFYFPKGYHFSDLFFPFLCLEESVVFVSKSLEDNVLREIKNNDPYNFKNLDTFIKTRFPFLNYDIKIEEKRIRVEGTNEVRVFFIYPTPQTNTCGTSRNNWGKSVIISDENDENGTKLRLVEQGFNSLIFPNRIRPSSNPSDF